MKVETMRWADGALELIDQRVLPSEFTYLSYNTADGVATAIRNMVVRGAPAIGVTAAYGVALEALRNADAPMELFLRKMAIGFDKLAESRPTAVNLFWALNRMRTALDKALAATGARAERVESDQRDIAESLLQEAHDIYREDIEANRAIGAHGQKLLKDGARVLTHCNAGALATAGHGTALGVIRSAVAAGKKISVIVNETRPFLQGARLTAWEMVQESIPCTLITDSMSGYLMSRGEIDAVIVGADRVAANGDVVNKIGTYMVAVLAKRHGIPFYVACPNSTIDLQALSGNEIIIEERPQQEILENFKVDLSRLQISFRNPSFDITSFDLITAIITQDGLISPWGGKTSGGYRPMI
jgi:methylthioribose-1-phosphate isomerase